MQFQADFSYRTEVVFMLLSTTVSISSTLVMYILIFTQVTTIGNWSISQLLYLYVWGNLAISIYTMFFWGSMYHQFRPAVKLGLLDLYLTKPAPHRFLLTTGRFDFSGLMRFIPSLLMLVYLLIAYPLPIGLASLLSFLLVSLLGIFLLGIFAFTVYCFSFWTTSTDYFHQFVWSIIGTVSMPINIFPEKIVWLLSSIFPMIFAAVIPTQLLIGQTTWYYALLPAVLLVILFNLVSNIIWHAGLRRYSGISI